MNELEPHQNTTRILIPILHVIKRAFCLFCTDCAEVIIIEYSPMDIHKLDGASLQMRIPSGHMAVGHQKCGSVKGIRHPSMPV